MGFRRLTETLTLFKTKDVKFATLSKRKCCNFLPCSRLDQAGRIENTKNGAQVCVFTQFKECARNQRKLCDRRGRKGKDLRGRPCSRHENVKSYTLFRQRTLKMIPWLSESPYIGNIWEYPYPRGAGPTSLPKQGDCHCFPMTESLRGWAGPVRQPAKLKPKSKASSQCCLEWRFCGAATPTPFPGPHVTV